MAGQAHICSQHTELLKDIRDLRNDIRALFKEQVRNRMLIIFLSGASAFGGSLIGNQAFRNDGVNIDTFDVNVDRDAGRCEMDAGTCRHGGD